MAVPAHAGMGRRAAAAHRTPEGGGRRVRPPHRAHPRPARRRRHAGAIRDDLARDALAGVLLQAIMFNSFATIISGKATAEAAADADPEVMWALFFRGMER